jgi:hypothetical protein
MEKPAPPFLKTGEGQMKLKTTDEGAGVPVLGHPGGLVWSRFVWDRRSIGKKWKKLGP